MKKTILITLIAFLCSLNTAKAQYMCTDINPDSVVSIPPGATLQLTYDVDINNDATMDFRFNSVQSGNAGFVIIQATQIGTNNAVLGDGANNCLALVAGAPIAPSSTVWVQMNGSNQTMSQILFAPPTGNFPGMGDRYVGLRFVVGPNTYYGWIRFNFSGAVNSYTVKDYGYNATPNASIAAGQACAPVLTPSFNITNNVCAVNSQTLTANTGTMAASGYTWSVAPPGPSIASPNASVTGITFTAGGTYTVTLSATSGSISGSSSKTIQVNPAPSLSISTTSSMLCSGQSATITGSGATSYSWNTGPTTTSIVVSPTITSTYTLTGYSSFSCVATMAFTQSVTTCAGFQENKLNQIFSVYPNPANNSLNISVKNSDGENLMVQMLDLTGRKVFEKNLLVNGNEHLLNLDVSLLQRGIYLVKLGSGNNQQIVKICLE